MRGENQEHRSHRRVDVSGSMFREKAADLLEAVIVESRVVFVSAGMGEFARGETPTPAAVLVPWDLWQAVLKSSELQEVLKRLGLEPTP